MTIPQEAVRHGILLVMLGYGEAPLEKNPEPGQYDRILLRGDAAGQKDSSFGTGRTYHLVKNSGREDDR